jgi:hypothetical protein
MNYLVTLGLLKNRVLMPGFKGSRLSINYVVSIMATTKCREAFLWLADYRDLFNEVLLALVGINVVSSLVLILLRFLIG